MSKHFLILDDKQFREVKSIYEETMRNSMIPQDCAVTNFYASIREAFERAEREPMDTEEKTWIHKAENFEVEAVREINGVTLTARVTEVEPDFDEEHAGAGIVDFQIQVGFRTKAIPENCIMPVRVRPWIEAVNSEDGFEDRIVPIPACVYEQDRAEMEEFLGNEEPSVLKDNLLSVIDRVADGDVVAFGRICSDLGVAAMCANITPEKYLALIGDWRRECREISH